MRSNYDLVCSVLDRFGLLLPPEPRMGGHGAGAAYVAIRDSADLERLVRHDLR